MWTIEEVEAWSRGEEEECGGWRGCLVFGEGGESSVP